MELVIDLSDRTAIRGTYGDCQKWREKGGVLRSAAPKSACWDPTQLLPARKWHTVLELGCGLRQWIKGLVAHAAPDAVLFACDLNEDVLRLFSKEFSALRSRISPKHHCLVADGENLPFLRGAFDGISAIFVGSHMVDSENFVKGLAGTLRPSGWLLTNSVDWSNPPPDFPSLALQRLTGEPSHFTVRNAFDETRARIALNRHFRDLREHKVTIPAIINTVEDLMKLHSRQEHFIRAALPPNYSWDDYASHVRELAVEYLEERGGFNIDLNMTHFLAERPRVS